MTALTILWVGRLTGPKGEIARKLAFEIAPEFSQVKFIFVGGPGVPESWPAPPENAHFIGQKNDVSNYYQTADLVIGAGRVALEAMKLARPVMAVGECCYVGLIQQQTIALGKASNFGDCFSPASIDWTALRQDLSAFVKGTITADTSAYTEYLADYDPQYVHQNVRKSYRQAMADAALSTFNEVPVLMYHQVPDSPPQGSIHCVYTVKEQLREQFSSLKKRGFQPVTFKELADGVRVKKPIILTFDDGYEDNYHNLLPLLEEFDFKAVIFALANESLTRNEWDIPGGEPPAALMTSEQLLACHQSGRIEIASHGLTHQHLPTLDADELAREMSDSKHRLEQLLDTEVVSFAYPFGDYQDREVAAAQSAGYLFAIATVSGPLHLADDFYRIRRINIMPKDRGIKFWKKTSGWYLRYCRWKGKDF
ncbi:polysaccharide deacetylase family protein [Motiliproteus sp. MSK22-1]|uniref:polysaccharide deacetylase family protein n=1 Tax=Motiliproteus sp. MSK22-1 TaxID=1897630 RepID=UPI0009771832|nr:polysaccharide deacetylase family protein [Motiliproteus sp. MSK22-1]OMH28012.1 hypothetical protein BGP75_21820 [Motiliproteus sp. MSK22-1]